MDPANESSDRESSPDRRPAHLDSLSYRIPRTASSSVETFNVNGTVIT
jgi:hypothetical protein